MTVGMVMRKNILEGFCGTPLTNNLNRSGPDPALGFLFDSLWLLTLGPPPTIEQHSTVLPVHVCMHACVWIHTYVYV